MSDVDNLLKRLRKETDKILKISSKKFTKSILIIYNIIEYVDLQNLKKVGFKDNREAAKAVITAFRAYLKDNGKLSTVVNIIDSTLANPKSVKAGIGARANLEKQGLILMLRFIESAMSLRDYCLRLSPDAFNKIEYQRLRGYLGELSDNKGDVMSVNTYKLTLGELYKAISISELENIRDALAAEVGEKRRSSETTKRRSSAS